MKRGRSDPPEISTAEGYHASANAILDQTETTWNEELPSRLFRRRALITALEIIHLPLKLGLCRPGLIPPLRSAVRLQNLLPQS